MKKYDIARKNMVYNHINTNQVSNKSLLEALNNTPKHLFIPDQYKGIAYCDAEIDLLSNRFLMPTLTFAKMIETSKIDKDSVVLDVGCNNGYSSAILSLLAKKVVSLESNPDFASKANSMISKLGIDNIIFIWGKLSEGHPESGPYDAIFINGAIKSVPKMLTDQLAENGRLITVIQKTKNTGYITIFHRKKNNITSSELFETSLSLFNDFK